MLCHSYIQECRSAAAIFIFVRLFADKSTKIPCSIIFIEKRIVTSGPLRETSWRWRFCRLTQFDGASIKLYSNFERSTLPFGILANKFERYAMVEVFFFFVFHLVLFCSSSKITLRVNGSPMMKKSNCGMSTRSMYALTTPSKE